MTESEAARSKDIREQSQRTLDLPLHRFIGVEFIDTSNPSEGVTFVVAEPTQNDAGMLHGGIMYSLLDFSALLSLLAEVKQGEKPVTHDLSVSLLRGVESGTRVEIRAQVLRRGRAIAFIRAEATADGEIVATAQITKTIVPPR